MTAMRDQQWVSPVVAVGVTGHRDLARPDLLRPAIDKALGLIRHAAKAALADDAVGKRTFKLRIVSPLAEGADRLVAQAGLDAHATLQCPLPMPKAEYLKDFATKASAAEFERLLAQAERVFELDMTGSRNEAYEEVGRLVLSQSDLLIAIWDGEAPKGKGGTGQIVAEALARRTPVLWLLPDMKAEPVIITGAIGRLVHHELETLGPTVAGWLTPPAPVLNENGHGAKWSTSAETFLKERPNPFWVLSGGFNTFVNLILLKFSWPKPPKLRWLADLWMQESRGYWTAPYHAHDHVKAVCQPCLEDRISTPFARADALATQYAGLYRTTFLVNFALSAFAVGCAIFAATEVHNAPIFEVIAILAIIGLTTLANARHYHERWIDYRHLAEQIRPLRFLFPLGLPLPQPRAAQFMEHGAAASWTEWLVKRLERELGLPSVSITPAYLNSVHDFATKSILQEQIDYHGRNRSKLAKVDHRLHRIGIVFFAITAVACYFDLFKPQAKLLFELIHLQEETGENLLLQASGILPALGAAVLGIRNIGEFARLELRSKGMEAALVETKTNLVKPPEEDQQRAVLSAHLEALAVQMMAETADWRTLVITRHIELPA